MSVDFGRRAAAYDRIRPVDDNWWGVFDLVVAEADLRGHRVLDVGCGTGRLARALAERGLARVWAVDRSREMLAVARANAPDSVGFKQAPAEDLPFRDGWFDRAVMWLVAHLVDRPRAFRDAARVLTADGRLAVVTFDPAHFEGFWLNRYFPSIEHIDRARFPTADALGKELREAGFSDIRTVRLSQVKTLAREQALERIHGRHISTFDLLGDDELRRGTALAERELPERIDYGLEWLVAIATKH